MFGMAANSQLRMRASDVVAKASSEYEQRLTPVTSLMEELFSPDEDLKVAGERRLSYLMVSLVDLQDPKLLEPRSSCSY